MKRLVYAPYVQAYVKADDGVFDLSPYIVRGSVNRKVNQVSSAQLTLRNPVQGGSSDLLFTEYRGAKGDQTPHPLIHPMDPIIIVMQRLVGNPVQVFTGYVDKSPYIQLYPGLCSLEASCTLKRLLYTQWDSSLPHVQNWLGQHGWEPNGSGVWNLSAETSGQFTDGSIGALLFDILQQIGEWDKSIIWIEALPPSIQDIVKTLYARIELEVQQGQLQYRSFLDQVLKTAGYGSGNPGGAGNNGGSGRIWKVFASSEDSSSGDGWTELSSNGNGAAAAGGVQSACCTGNSIGCCDYATLGQAYPHGTMLKITNPTTKQSGVFPLTDVGNGSSSGPPAIGLTPTVQTAIGMPGGGWVEIQLANGGDLSVASGFGTLISTPSTTTTTTKKKTGSTAPPKKATHASTAPTSRHGPITYNTTRQVAKTASAKTASGSTKTGSKPKTTTSSAASQDQGYVNPFSSPPSPSRVDMGVDYGGTGITIKTIGRAYVYLADSSSTWPGGGFVAYTLLDGYYKGQNIYVAENISPSVSSNTHVPAGHPIATMNGGIETGWADPGRTETSWFATQSGINWSNYDTATGATTTNFSTAAGRNFNDLLTSLGVPGGSVGPPLPVHDTYTGKASVGGSGTGGGTGGTNSGSGASSLAAAFSAMLDLPGIFSQAEAEFLSGKRSFIADQPLFPFVQQLCTASMRNFMSMPNGNFLAFFPDYFGYFGRKYYWEIKDIEIIDGRIDLNDDALLTHMGVAGDTTTYSGEVQFADLIGTAGIFDIFDAIATGYITGLISPVAGQQQTTVNSGSTGGAGHRGLGANVSPADFANYSGANKNSAIAFLQRYGARPFVEELPAIRSPIYELFLAFQNFLIAWSRQFQTPFELTFMPELFPGGIVAFPDHHFQVYVEEVVHNFDYEQGFTTTANFSAPSGLPNDGLSRPNLSEGNARPVALNPVGGTSQTIGAGHHGLGVTFDPAPTT